MITFATITWSQIVELVEDQCHLRTRARHGASVPRGLRPPGAAAPGRGRFGRMFPQLPAGDLCDGCDRSAGRRRCGAPSARRQPGIPAGFTYLAQFIDHDITFDPTLAAASSSTTRSRWSTSARRAWTSTRIYGSGPADQPFLYEWTDPPRARAVQARGRDRRPAAQRAGPRADRRSAQRREPHPRAAAPAVHPLPQQGRRPRPRAHGSGGRGAARRGAADRALALPVDRRARLPAAHRRPGDGGLGARAGRAQVLPGGGRAVHPGRVLGRGVPVRPQHGAQRLQAQRRAAGRRRDPRHPGDDAGELEPPRRVPTGAGRAEDRLGVLLRAADDGRRS